MLLPVTVVSSLKMKYLLVLIFFASVEPSWSATGKSRIKRIIGGPEVLRNQYPFMADLRDVYGTHNNHDCGASIISESWAVTAAHCQEYPAFVYRLIAGDHNNSYTEGTEQERHVKEIIIHEGYDTETIENDIALVRVDPPFTFNGYVNSVSLPPKDSKPQGKALALGWGRKTPGGNSSTLQQVVLPILSDELCTEAHGDLFLKDSMLCAGYLKGQMDFCQGDSGGPLVKHLDGKWVLVGIVSWSEDDCASKLNPGVYTRASSYVDWIVEQLKRRDFSL